MSSLDPAIVEEFFAEGNEHLDSLEASLLRLEGNASDQDAIDRSFRAAHSIKGAAGFLGLVAVERLMHAAEDLLDLIRHGTTTVDRENAGLLLKAGDRCRALLDAAKRGEDVDPATVDDHVSHLRAVVARVKSGDTPASGLPTHPSATQPTAPEPEPSAAPVLTRAVRVPRNRPVVPAGEDPFPLPPPTSGPPQVSLPPVAAPTPAVPPPPSAAPAVVAPVPLALAVSSPPAAPTLTPMVSPAPPQAAPVVAETARPVEASKLASAASEVHAADASTGTIRVDVGLLDDIMNLVGELVVARNRLVQIVGERDDRTLALASRRVDHLTSDLQTRVMKTRMRPVAVAWGALPRLVRDVAASTGKLVQVEMIGQDTELDRSLLEVIKDPLSHMIRNCVDHGIEVPDQRVAAGKPPMGTITLRSRHSGGQVHIDVSDDGRGIQVDKVRARAVQNGVVTADQAASMDDDALLQLIFLPGFSTAEKVSNLSGRGVGMDVVKSSVEKVGGSVDIRSVPGEGSTIRLKLPLTLAIVPALITLVGGRRFCFPQANLVEIVDLVTREARDRVEWLAGAPLFRLRGELLPLVPLGNTLAVTSTDDLQGYIVVVDADDLTFGVVVDDIQHTEEIVVKPVGAEIKRVQVFSGATVLGDGSVALILDVVALARRGRVAARTHEAAEQDRDRQKAQGEGGEQRTLLRLNVDGIGHVAVDVGSVLRIDELRSVEVFAHAGDTVFRYLDRVVPVRRLADGAGTWNEIVVCEQGDAVVGIAVTEVLDVVSAQVKITRGMGPAWADGVTFLLGQPTALLDVGRVNVGRSA